MAISQTEAQRRAHALDTASRLGLPYGMTLDAARAYLAFLNGEEAVPQWRAMAVGEAAVLRRTIGKAAADIQGQKPTKTKRKAA